MSKARKLLRQYNGIVDRLLRGQEPGKDFGTFIGEGSERAAYRYGAFVVKRSSQWWQDARGDWKMTYEFSSVRDQDSRVRRAPTRRVNGFDIQLAYTPFTRQEGHTFTKESPAFLSALDFGYSNMGYDHRGRITVYDW